MLYDLQGKGIVDVTGFDSKCKKEGSFDSNEPISVLDKRRSPSPSTSTSTHSYGTGTVTGGGGGGGGSSSTDNIASLAAVSDTTLHQKWPTFAVQPEMGGSGGGRKDEWAAELQPISAGLEVGVGSSQRFGLGLEDWETLLSESEASHGQDQSLLRWISGDVEDTSFSLKQLLQGGNVEIDDNAPVGTPIDQGSMFETSAPGGNLVCHSLAFPATGSAPAPAPAPNFLPFANPDQKPQPFNPQFVLNPTQIQTMGTHSMFAPLPDQFQPQPKRHNPGFPKAPFLDPGHQLPQLGLANHLLQKPMMVPKLEMVSPAAAAGHHHNQQQQVVYDQLYSAAELILAGNFSHAQGILARLNHQLSPMAKPFQRAAFYFKEALQIPLLISSNSMPRSPNPFDGMFKMGAYKVLSEVSPLIQFMNFTANQTILEAIEDAEQIHIVDFDIGFGAQWASFMQELPRRNNGGCSSPSLKITAFASPSTHHPIELELMHENLSQFACEIGLSFELEVVNFDSFDPSSFLVSANEAIAVNFPIWSCATHLPAIPSLLRFIKQLSPRVVVSPDRGCERTDLPFVQYLLHGLQYYEVLLDSIDAANLTSDTANKIEKFLFQPRIESMVMGRLQSPDQMPYWKTLFASAGYSPVALSNFAETQAECVVKRTHIRGFHVEKRQASLVLCWQHRELMSASAWKF